MAKTKPLFAESTDVPVSKSMAEITTLLIQSGAVAISQELDHGHVIGLSFVIPYGAGRIPFRLPVRVDPVFQKLNGRRDAWGAYSRAKKAKDDRDQAERIAWRQLYWWLKSQFALIELGMVESAEVFLPYMLANDGRTFFDTYRPRMIEGPKGEAKST